MKLLPSFVIASALLLSAQASAATLTIACGTVGQEFEMCKAGAQRWAKQTGNSVKFFDSPANGRLGLFQQQLAAKSSDIDVYQLDVIWPGLLAQHFVDLKGKVPQGELQQHYPAAIAAATVDGKLVSLPWFGGGGVLYYRTDLLKKYGYSAAPRTWNELSTMAKRVQAGEQKTNKSFTGFVWQGKNYEGLTCDALEWVASYGGGTIVDSSGKITINNPQAAKALDMAASWVGDISPAGVTTYGEEDARGIFQSGNALFMRNWPYAWALGQDKDSAIRNKFAISALPSGGSGRSATALGGQNLGVSMYSKNQDAAISLVRYLTSPAEQKIRAVEGAFNPTIPAIYRDKDVLAANPFFSSLEKVFSGAVPRPSAVTKEKYNQVSQAFAGAVSEVLSGKAKSADALSRLASDLARVKGRGW